MDNYYADARGAQAPEETPEAKPENSSDSETVVIPKSALGGRECKPGEELNLKVVQVNEDSVLAKVGYSEDEESESPDVEQEEVPDEAPPPSGMAGMME